VSGFTHEEWLDGRAIEDEHEGARAVKRVISCGERGVTAGGCGSDFGAESSAVSAGVGSL